MGPQAWKGQAMADLHEILFRPGATLFASKSYAKQRNSRTGKFTKLDSKAYSPIARSFLEDKDPLPTDYFKCTRLYRTAKCSGHHGDHTSIQEQGPQSPKWNRGDLLPTSLRQPPRKGELPPQIIKTIWGPMSRRQAMEDEKLEEEATELIRKLRKKKGEADRKVVECLMDVLLRSWVYFEHSHEKIKSVCNHVHAKYCEEKFGHYLLADGTQIHGSFVISLRQLITELKALIVKLKAKVSGTSYQDVPIWKPPPLEEILGFCAPEEQPMPKLYPIEGLLVPEDDIPLDSNIPLLRTPSVKPHPPYIKPKFPRKDAVLSIPPLETFSKEERSIEHYKNISPPIFNPPEALPLPIWQDPQEEPLPAMPIIEEAKAVQAPPLEIIPPYEVSKREPRPCEASYYPIEPGQSSICDGLCGRRMESDRQNQGGDIPQHACLGRLRPQLTIPDAPTFNVNLPPTFIPPKEEPLPPFVPPLLIPEPPHVGPPKPNIPEWIPPAPPPPVGYLAGHRPVFLVDCSATMAGDRMNIVHSAIRHLFSKGGQVDIAATHFDIIMYSFDAWSFGALEEERKYRMNGSGPFHWVKSLEFMQPKTHENVEKALSWMSQWRTGGTSNLKKAIEVAMQRTSADCIYVLTSGKCDRPVIIMNTLKDFENERKLTPIYPVGLEPTKAQARILRNVLAEISGGQYMELDMNWQYKLYKEQTENLVSEDIKQLTTKVEHWQRQSLMSGVPERADAILKRLKKEFFMTRKDPLVERYKLEEEKAQLQHKYLVGSIRAENRRAIEHAQDYYNATHALVLQTNKKLLEEATKIWEDDVRKVRAMNEQNKELYDEWQIKVSEIHSANKRSRQDARKIFLEDVKRIEDRHAHRKLHGREEHDAIEKRTTEKNELLLRNHTKKQLEIVSKAKVNNAASWKEYEDKCADIKALNARNLQTARIEFATACEKVVTENQRRMKEAEEDHKWRFEVVTNENAKRKKEHMAKLEDLHQKKIEARKSHQLRVSAMVEEHKASIAAIAAINSNLEQEAKRAWEESCTLIDEENKRTTNKCYEEWKEATRIVQMQNEELARRRTALQLGKEEVEKMNSELVRKKKMAWKEACRKLEERYLEDTERAKAQYERYLKEIQLHNERLIEKAKISFDAEVVTVTAYNESIRPNVEESESVEKEIKRIQDFLGYIVSQSSIPSDKKSSKKLTLEQRLAMLSNLDSPCPPKVIIGALQTAYAGDLNRHSDVFFEATMKNLVETGGNVDESNRGKRRQQGRFSGMKQIQPARVQAHHCADFKLDAEDKIHHSGKLKKDTSATFEGQEAAIGNTAPTVKKAKLEKGS